MASSREVSRGRRASDRDEGERAWDPGCYARVGTLGRGFRSQKRNQKGPTTGTTAGTSGVGGEHRRSLTRRSGPQRIRAVVLGRGAAHSHMVIEGFGPAAVGAAVPDERDLQTDRRVGDEDRFAEPFPCFCPGS